MEFLADLLARHRRIHEPRADGEVPNIEEEELENEEREFGDVDEASPREEQGYLPGNMSGASPMATGGVNMSMMSGQHQGMGMAAPSQLIQAQQQLLQGQM